MTEYLGKVFKTGDEAPDTCVFQLIGDHPTDYERVDMSRVLRLEKGEVLPSHPDTGQPTEWRCIRLTADERPPDDLKVTDA